MVEYWFRSPRPRRLPWRSALCQIPRKGFIRNGSKFSPDRGLNFFYWNTFHAFSSLLSHIRFMSSRGSQSSPRILISEWKLQYAQLLGYFFNSLLELPHLHSRWCACVASKGFYSWVWSFWASAVLKPNYGFSFSLSSGWCWSLWALAPDSSHFLRKFNLLKSGFWLSFSSMVLAFEVILSHAWVYPPGNQALFLDLAWISSSGCEDSTFDSHGFLLESSEERWKNSYCEANWDRCFAIIFWLEWSWGEPWDPLWWSCCRG